MPEDNKRRPLSQDPKKVEEGGHRLLQVYFRTPPDRRHQALVEELKKIQAENPKTSSSLLIHETI